MQVEYMPCLKYNIIHIICVYIDTTCCVLQNQSTTANNHTNIHKTYYTDIVRPFPSRKSRIKTKIFGCRPTPIIVCNREHHVSQINTTSNKAFFQSNLHDKHKPLHTHTYTQNNGAILRLPVTQLFVRKTIVPAQVYFNIFLFRAHNFYAETNATQYVYLSYMRYPKPHISSFLTSSTQSAGAPRTTKI